MSALWSLSIEEAAAQLAAGSVTARQLTDAFLERIAQLDPQIGAFTAVFPEAAMAAADASDARRAAGKTLGLLDGIPFNLKDVFVVPGHPTTASSHMLEGWMPPYESTVAAKLREAGAVLLGMTNTDEFTMGVSTETSYQGVTRNPWDVTRVSGGSSGGPAASIAAQFGIFAIGTDTGGSIRQPASFCGVVGVRPTYGRVSRWGEVAMASSLDQAGPITRTARDAAIVLEVIAGHDPYDATSHPVPVPNYLATSADSIKGVRVGLPKEYFGEGVRPEVEELVRAAVAQLEGAGAIVEEVSLPASVHALAAYYIIAPAEVSSNMARYDGIRYGHSIEREATAAHSLATVYAQSRAEGLGAEVKRRIMLGTHVLSSGYYDAYYKKAEAVRAVVAAEFAEIFTKVDVLAAPVSPHPAFPIGKQVNDPLAMYKEDVLAAPLNIGGVPGLSVPCGFVDGLPVGLQLITARFEEARLLQVAAAYQALSEHHTLYPELIPK